METKSLNYQYLSKHFVTLPYLSILLVCFTVYLSSDMVSSIKDEISYIQKLNHILAQTAKTQNRNLIAEQVQYVSQSMSEVESIHFFATQSENKLDSQLSLYTMFFGTFYTMHEPVTLHITNRNNEERSQLIGYINTTINLKHIRQSWFNSNVSMFFWVLVASLISLMILLAMLKKATRRLPILEELSAKVLNNEEIDEQSYHSNNNEKNVWLYEKALFHLLKTQKKQQYNLEKLNTELVLTKDAFEHQGEQYSNFQSSLTHELQLSLDDINAGLKLLQSQYISNEQKDAVEMINIGSDDLNTRLNELIQLNRIEKGQATVELRQFNPSHLLNNIVEKFSNQAHEKNLLLVAKNYHADYVLEGDVQKIDIILSSLVENALKFTEQGEVVIASQIQHLDNNIRWTIQVIDTGIGIDKSHFSQIFQPFFQVSPNKRHSKLNTTVGLFLTHKIAELINANIEVSSEIDKGSTFTLQIILKDWNNHTEQQVFQDKKIAIWYKNEDVIHQAQRLINTGSDIQRFKDNELLLDYLGNNSVDLLIITFKLSVEEVISLTKRLREIEINHHFRTLILYYYNPKYLKPEQEEQLKSVGVDYLENAKADVSLNEHIQRIVQYLS